LPYDAQTYYITYYHDQDDSVGLLEIAKSPSLSERDVLLYQIFKDADGLVRFHLLFQRVPLESGVSMNLRDIKTMILSNFLLIVPKFYYKKLLITL
jgi:hypothetical protein